MSRVIGIYKIASLSHPDRCYIGSSSHLSARWSGHRKNLQRNKHHNNKLQNHYNKYGKDDLEFSIIKLCEIDKLIEREQYYIDLFLPKFNISPTAGSNYGIKATPESIEKNRLAKLGGKHTQETILKISESQIGENNSFYGKKHSNETLAKMRKPKTDEFKQKIVEAWVRRRIKYNLISA